MFANEQLAFQSTFLLIKNIKAQYLITQLIIIFIPIKRPYDEFQVSIYDHFYRVQLL
jgi:hypothetical protein